jgi:hypothetical protein
MKTLIFILLSTSIFAFAETADHSGLLLKIGRVALGQEESGPDDQRAAVQFLKYVDQIADIEKGKAVEIPDSNSHVSVTEYKIRGYYLGGSDVILCPTTTIVTQTVQSWGEAYRDSFKVRFEFDGDPAELNCPRL